MEKSALIKEDSVTCAIYFHKIINVILLILQSKKLSPFGKFRVKHYFKRIKFQHRGSPDVHILMWPDESIDDALGNDYSKAIELINTLITILPSESSGNIKLQTHKHTFTCYKTIFGENNKMCRFEAPFMSSRSTIILVPM